MHMAGASTESTPSPSATHSPIPSLLEVMAKTTKPESSTREAAAVIQQRHRQVGVQSTRGKTRAQKDREVAKFLNRHEVNRDAKTVGTKWDNMLGEFRKVYEWEKGGEREPLVGKSYFRLSPYERKLHRLPASFDEEVFAEFCKFMGPRMRSSPRGLPYIIASSEIDASGIRALPQPPPFKDDDPLSPAAGSFYDPDCFYGQMVDDAHFN